MFNIRSYLRLTLIAVSVPLAGCSFDLSVGGPDSTVFEPPEPGDEVMPEFSLVDVNEDSARFGEAVSPRDYLGQISAWYFGRAT